VFDTSLPLVIPGAKAGVPMLLHHNRNYGIDAPDYTLYPAQNHSNKLQ
jgi:hypothetical protein